MSPPTAATAAAASGGLASLLLQKQQFKQKNQRQKKKHKGGSGDIGGDGNASLAVDGSINDADADDAFLPSAPPAEGGAAFSTFLGSLMKGEKARRKAERKAMAKKKEEEGNGGGGIATPTAAADEENAADAGAAAAAPAPLAAALEEEDSDQQQQQQQPRPDPSDAFLDCPAAAAAAPSEAAGSEAEEKKKKQRLAAAELDQPLPRSWAEEGPISASTASPSAAAAVRWLVGESEAPELGGFPRSPPTSLAAAGIRPRVAGHWRELLATDARAARERGIASSPSSSTVPAPFGEFASEEQACFLGALRTYRDVLFCSRPYPTEPVVAKKGKNKKKSTGVPAAAAAASASTSSASSFSRDDLQDAYLLHVASHVVASANRIRKNNEAIAAAEAAARSGGSAADAAAAAAASAPPRDQGFARPKVLLLLPLRSIALRAVLR